MQPEDDGLPPLPTVADIWARRGLPMSAWEELLERSRHQIRRHFRRLGFRRTSGGRTEILDGPCVECGTIQRTEWIDTRGWCDGCRRQPADPVVARERKASIERQRRREREGDPLQRVYTPPPRRAVMAGLYLRSRRSA